MNPPSEPIFVIPSLDPDHRSASHVLLKALVASLLRTHYSGSIVVFRASEEPLFKVERARLSEVQIAGAASWGDRRRMEREFLFGLGSQLMPEPRQWVIVANCACLALRNVDHLLPPELSGPYAPPVMDLLWTRVEGVAGGSTGVRASSALWAVRGERLQETLAIWKEIAAAASDHDCADTVWSRVIMNSPLRKRPYERGEVVCPSPNAVDWRALVSSAFVAVPDWPEEERSKFLQAMYFQTFFGDKTGMMIHLLES